MKIHIHSIASPLHNVQLVEKKVDSLLSLLHSKGFDNIVFDDVWDISDMHLYHIATGGTERIFLKLLDKGKISRKERVLLIAGEDSNALAASMEILSYVNTHGMEGEIIHGNDTAICDRLGELSAIAEAYDYWHNGKLGVIGKPSDWLIASSYDSEVVKKQLQTTLIEIDIKELTDIFHDVPDDICNEETQHLMQKGVLKANAELFMHSIPDAVRIYLALKTIINHYQLKGCTLRCFDLLGTLHNTGCLALSLLNAEGIIAGCEGDVPTMLSMYVAKGLTGQTGFMANPSRIDVSGNRVTFAHCTIPMDMVSDYEFNTHFESGIGVAVQGKMPEGAVTVFKMDGALKRCFAEEGMLITNLREDCLCRTQIVTEYYNPHAVHTMLTQPIGNHHVILAGHHADSIKELLKLIK